MIKKIFFLTIISLFLLSNICESAFARAGGRSSFGSGRSGTSYSNQGSRGSRTYQGGGYNSQNYAPMQKSSTSSSNFNGANRNSQFSGAQPMNSSSPSFFQRHPVLSTFGAAMAGSWIGHMLFGGSSGGYAAGMAGGSAGGGGFLVNFIIIILGAVAAIMLIRFLNRRSSNRYGAEQDSSSAAPQPIWGSSTTTNQTMDISLPETENKIFADILVNVQNAWSNQDIDKLKRLTTPEMAGYFSENLSQNTSQGIANKVENVDVISAEISESWQEGEMEYATAILKWSSFDYMINLDKTSADTDYIAEGNNKNLAISSEAWTFVRYSGGGKWILSAIAQIE